MTGCLNRQTDMRLAAYALAPQMGLAGKSTLDFGQWPQIPSLRVVCDLHQPFHGDLRRAG